MQPRRKMIRRVWAALLLVAILSAGGWFYHYCTNPERIRTVAQNYLQRFVHGRVTVGAASLSWLSHITLLDVSIDEVTAEASGRRGLERKDGPDPVFSCREVRITQDGLRALLGSLKIRSVKALSPTCNIARNTADGRTNLSGLFRLSQFRHPGDSRSLPTIELSDAHIRVVSREALRDRVVQDLTVTVRALPSKHDPMSYDVVWRSDHDRETSGYSRINLQTGRLRNIQGGLPPMSIEAVMLAIDAKYDGTGAWSELLGLDGTVRARDYHLNGSAKTDEPRSATIELSDARISIPINTDERSLRPENRYLRFDRVRGQVQLSGERIHADFSGRFHGHDCHVTMTLRSGVKKLRTLDDVDIDAHVSVKGLVLPRPDPQSPPSELRFIRHWGRLVAFYHDYDPHGAVDLDMSVVKKHGPQEPIVLRRLVMNARGGDASCRFFPYRLRNLEGTVEYLPDGIRIHSLQGRHAQGMVTIDGLVSAPTRWAKKTLTIHGSAVSIDKALVQSLPSRYQWISRLFRPKGTIDVQLQLDQPQSDPSGPVHWRSHSTITLQDVSTNFVRFPYPVDQLTGTLTFDNKKLEVINLAGRSGEAKIDMEGGASFTEGRITDLDLTVHGSDVPLDGRLFSALPEKIRREVLAFHPQGRFDVRTKLTWDPKTQQVVHTSDVSLNEVSSVYDEFPVSMTEIIGHLRITPDEVFFDGLTGRSNGGTFSIEGQAESAGKTWASGLTIRTRGLRFDQALRQAMPANLRDLLADWTVSGPVATETIVSTDPAHSNTATTIHTQVQLSRATVGYALFPIPFTDVEGVAFADESHIRAKSVKARYGAAKLEADFNIHETKGGDEGTIILNAQGISLNDSVRNVAGGRWAGAWDRLQPGGAIDLHLAELHFVQPSPQSDREWSVQGDVELHDVALRGLAHTQGVFGTVTASGSLVDRLGGTSLTGSVTLPTVEVLHRKIDHLQSDWTLVRVAKGEGMMTADSIRGSIYDGSLSGQVELQFDPHQTHYSLSTTVRDMQIEPFLKAPFVSRLANLKSSALAIEGQPSSRPVNSSLSQNDPSQVEPKEGRVRGLADGHLYFSGVMGKPTSRRGGGRFEIHEGHIYRLPIILAILNVLNLSIPNEDAFEEAQADYYVVGNRVQFDNIRLHGSVLALIGSGSLSLPDGGIHLDLVSVSPRQWARTPILSDLIEGASRELMGLLVTGPIAHPTVRVRPLPHISDEFKRLFRARTPVQKIPSK